MSATYVGRLNKVLKLSDGVLQVIKTDLVVLDDQVDLQLGDTVSDWDELGTSPDETVHLDRSNRLLKLLHVGLIVPWLDLHGDNGLGSRLVLSGLLGGVLGQSLLTEVDGSLVLFLVFVRSEQVDVVLVSGLSSRCLGLSGGLWAVCGCLLAGIARKSTVLLSVGSDVFIPPGSLLARQYGCQKIVARDYWSTTSDGES